MSWTIDLADDQQLSTFRDQETGWQLRSNPSHPEQGLTFGHADSGFDARSLFQLTSPETNGFPSLTDAFIRGADLISSYPEGESDRFGIEVCHRVAVLNDRYIAVESICAVQTQLLDCHPTFGLLFVSGGQPVDLPAEVKSSVRQAVSLAVAERADMPPLAMRLSVQGNSPQSALILFPQADRAAATMSVTNDGSVHIEMLAEFLEKGVIRKARWWTIYGHDLVTPEQISDCYLMLLAKPLPLTP